jgi:hypothetical protein
MRKKRTGDEDMVYDSRAAAKSATEEVLPPLLALEASGTAVVATYSKPGGAFSGAGSSTVSEKEDRDTLVLPIPFVGIGSIAPRVQHGKAVSGGWSLFSESVGSFPSALDDEAEPEGSNGGGEEDEGEATLLRAMKLRRSARWSIVHYMLRPV